MMLLCCIIVLLMASWSDACTIVAVGKEATKNGAVMISHTDDAGVGTNDLRLVRVPALSHKAHATRAVYGIPGQYPRLVTHERGPLYKPVEDQVLSKPLGHIPQVRHTFAYFDQEYGMMNEKGLSIGESTCRARTVGWSQDLPHGRNLFSIHELTKVALERCATARCAIKTIGDLASQHGFYSNSGTPAAPDHSGAGEALAVADNTGEVWILNILTGPGNASAVWAAQRVPDDHVAAVANAFTIRTLDLADSDRFMASTNVESFARDMGWWAQSGPVDFALAYDKCDPPAPAEVLGTGRRMWRVYTLAGPSLRFSPYLGYLPGWRTYPFSVKPDSKLGLPDVIRILRDYYEGTEFSLTEGLAAGPFGYPMRWDGDGGLTGGWERSISVFRATYSFVAEVRARVPAAVSGVLWYGQDAPHGTAYVPFFGGQAGVPRAFLEGKMSVFSLKSAWWPFNLINNWSYLRYDLIHAEVVAEQARLMTRALALVRTVVEEAAAHPRDDPVPHAERVANDYAQAVPSHSPQFPPIPLPFAPNSLPFPSHFPPISLPFPPIPPHSPPISPHSLPFPSHFPPMSLPCPSHFPPISRPFPSHFLPFPSHFPPIPPNSPPFPSHFPPFPPISLPFPPIPLPFPSYFLPCPSHVPPISLPFPSHFPPISLPFPPISLPVPTHFPPISFPLPPISLPFPSHFPPIAPQFPPISLPFPSYFLQCPSHVPPISLPFPSHFPPISLPFPPISHPFPAHFPPISLPFPSHFPRISQGAVDAWWALAFRLIAKYNNGQLVHGEGNVYYPGYPAWWLRAVGYDRWPGYTWVTEKDTGGSAVERFNTVSLSAPAARHYTAEQRMPSDASDTPLKAVPAGARAAGTSEQNTPIDGVEMTNARSTTKHVSLGALPATHDSTGQSTPADAATERFNDVSLGALQHRGSVSLFALAGNALVLCFAGVGAVTVLQSLRRRLGYEPLP